MKSSMVHLQPQYCLNLTKHNSLFLSQTSWGRLKMNLVCEPKTLFYERLFYELLRAQNEVKFEI